MHQWGGNQTSSALPLPSRYGVLHPLNVSIPGIPSFSEVFSHSWGERLKELSPNEAFSFQDEEEEKFSLKIVVLIIYLGNLSFKIRIQSTINYLTENIPCTKLRRSNPFTIRQP